MARTSPTTDRPTIDYVGRTGPHRVAAGPLDPSGMPGEVVAPVSGRDLPVVVLAHGWLQPVRRYARLARHLASWGFVVVLPATENGPLPSPSAQAHDLSRALRTVVRGRLAGGVINASGAHLGVLGHSTGGAAAVLAAASDPAVRAVVTVTAASGRTALEAAPRVTVPGLHLVGRDDAMSQEVGARLARSWGGPVLLRAVKDGAHLGLSEGKHWTTALLGDGAQKRVQQVTRSLATAFLLRHLADQDQLAGALEGSFSGTTLLDPHEQD